MTESWTTTGGDRVEVWSAHGLHYWHVRAANGEVVEQGEAYVHRGDAVEAALRHHPKVAES